MTPSRSITRRKLLKVSAAGLATVAAPLAWPQSKFSLNALSDQIIDKARSLASGKALNLLVPQGSETNISAVTTSFEQKSGISVRVTTAPVDDINTRLLLTANSSAGATDVALPATYGIADLARAKVIMPLDELAEKYEPPHFRSLFLYDAGDTYLDQFYGYQTDGDVYLMFLNSALWSQPSIGKAFEDKTGHSYHTLESWAEIDLAMSLAHSPDQDRYGGSLFRTPSYMLWEFWLRMHEKNCLPLAPDATPQINHPAAIEALSELINAGQFLEPGVQFNNLFENWSSYSQGNKLMNIGWGGSQKAFQRQPAEFSQSVEAFTPPGPLATGLPYFNWGWNYTVAQQSAQPELAYLFTLYAVSPQVSTIAVRENAGYFDPFQTHHYQDAAIQSTYSKAFLDVHESAMKHCIPDFYIVGQGQYFATLTNFLQLALQGRLSPSDALDLAQTSWQKLHREIGWETQQKVWQALLLKYRQQQ